MPDLRTDVTRAARDLANVAVDATYIVIGAGVLGFQRIQVERHQLGKKLSTPNAAGLGGRVTAVRSDLADAIQDVDAKVDLLMDRVEEIIERVEAAFAPLEDRLPTQARDLAKQAHVQAKEARTQLRTLRPSAAA